MTGNVQPPNGAPGDNHGDKEEPVIRRQAPGFFSKLKYASCVYGMQAILRPLIWLREKKESRYPPKEHPNLIKTYPCRPHLPVRVFLPPSYYPTSPDRLPTLFTIHYGGFCIGHQRDDDEWNRTFADTHSVLVISLNYSKAPRHRFPTAPHDVAALLLACLDDPSLPIDHTRHRRGESQTETNRIALLGFSAGGNLALSIFHLPSIRSHPSSPSTVLSIYPALDLSVPPADKFRNRPWKPSLPAPRGNSKDALAGLVHVFDWAYIPAGTDLRDPLLSPYYVAAEHLPPYVCLVGAELDMLGHEAWRMACRLKGEKKRRHGVGAAEKGEGGGVVVVPDRMSGDVRWRVCGTEDVVAQKGEIVGVGGGGKDERFAFEETWEGGGVKWLLVPDVLHGFDNKYIRFIVGGRKTTEDAKLKAEAYRDELARWLREVAWRA